MQRHHYALQALLYLVALHRYLRWRVPGYDPDAPPRRASLYLFVRGMIGADDAGRRRDAVRRVRLAAAGGARAARSATRSTGRRA